MYRANQSHFIRVECDTTTHYLIGNLCYITFLEPVALMLQVLFFIAIILHSFSINYVII